jgi:hypothetical protein
VRAGKAERVATALWSSLALGLVGLALRRDAQSVQASRLFAMESQPMIRTTSEATRLLRPVVARVSNAIRKLATAASSHLGRDCYLHMELGHVLLADLGLQADRALGFAAWRVGGDKSDVIAHVPFAQAHSPPGAKAFPFHAWLLCQGHVIDFTTYQLRIKGKALDAADGGRTNVTWCPEFLLLPRKETRTYRQVASGFHPGLAYYEVRSELNAMLESKSEPDPAALRAARVLIANPDVVVFGPNTAAHGGGDGDESP